MCTRSGVPDEAARRVSQPHLSTWILQSRLCWTWNTCWWRLDRSASAFTLHPVFRCLIFSWFRVPPFLISVEDPRAAQGASLTGCPVCGGEFEDFICWAQGRLNVLRRSWSRYFAVSEARRQSKATDGRAEERQHGRELLTTSRLHLVLLIVNRVLWNQVSMLRWSQVRCQLFCGWNTKQHKENHRIIHRAIYT